MVRYQHVKYQEKTNDPILKTFSDGWTDAQTWTGRRTERLTDKRVTVQLILTAQHAI